MERDLEEEKSRIVFFVGDRVESKADRLGSGGANRAPLVLLTGNKVGATIIKNGHGGRGDVNGDGGRLTGDGGIQLMGR